MSGLARENCLIALRAAEKAPPLMPLGTQHSEVGLLLEDRGLIVLRCDDGGTWRVEATLDLREHIGRRVEINGRRDGFDLLAVERLRVLSGASPSEYCAPFVATREFWLGVTTILVGLPLLAGLISLFK